MEFSPVMQKVFNEITAPACRTDGSISITTMTYDEDCLIQLKALENNSKWTLSGFFFFGQITISEVNNELSCHSPCTFWSTVICKLQAIQICLLSNVIQSVTDCSCKFWPSVHSAPIVPNYYTELWRVILVTHSLLNPNFPLNSPL